MLNKVTQWKVKMHMNSTGQGMWIFLFVEAATRTEAEEKAAKLGKGTAYPFVGLAKRNR